ncbi:IclR family transcriptional regulator [Sphingomonas lenta]|uniref:IclR family transcriptional regulator n=2 Tax=Sphingomonas lenta TaxID=1141887 RepID=A0A2A2SEU6_9SPHN|nr:IclR family transcriptional regulator [Sphingomonas lenta]
MVADAPRPLRFTEILQYSGMPRGSLHRILQALQEARMLKLDERDQTYRLGNRLFEMAHRVWSEFDLRGAAEPELERLREAVSETTRLGLLDGEAVLIIDQREYPRPMRLGNGVGSRLSAPASAIGKAILAYLPPKDLRLFLNGRPLDALTPNTISNPDELQRELDLVKARGYAVSIEEQFIGVSAVAAPILDHRGVALGAISITGTSNRLTAERLHTLGRDVIEAARRTSGNVGETFMSIAAANTPIRGVDAALSCAFPSGAFLGEAPAWLPDQDALLWVDILAPAINVSTPANGGTRSVRTPELVSAVVPRRRGGFVATMQGSIRGIDLHSGDTTDVAVPTDMTGRRFNDAKCDPAGRLWAGTLALDASPGQGTLYRLDVDGALHAVERGFHICNGLGWSPDATRFYLADSGAATIFVYDYDLASGTVANRRALVECDASHGVPDGLAVDEDGYLWVAIWDGWEVRRYAPDGSLDRTVAVPVPRPTSCAFGGPDLRTLYVTSARIRLSATQLAAAPLSGSVFSMATDVAGVPVTPFAG